MKSSLNPRRIILSKPYSGSELVEFNSFTGKIDTAVGFIGKPAGNCCCVKGKWVVLFCTGGSLILQIGLDKWSLACNEVGVKYFHRLESKKTYFEVSNKQNSFSIEYKSWWADIPSFEPVEPEMDADEDYLAYIFSIWRDKQLIQSLISEWT